MKKPFLKKIYSIWDSVFRMNELAFSLHLSVFLGPPPPPPPKKKKKKKKKDVPIALTMVLICEQCFLSS